MMYTVEILSRGMTFLQCCTKIRRVVQAILGVFIRNLNGCNVGNADGKEL
jgi:hypothetical protein